MLPYSEWLADAQSLPVNRSKRVYHGAERRPNLVVQNLPDRWIAYCHHCHEGAVKMKEYATVQVEEPTLVPNLDTSTLVPIESVLDKKLAMFLHTKGVSAWLLGKYGFMYNTADKRLVYKSKQGAIGRDTTGTSPSKWYVYRNPPFSGWLYLQPENAYDTRVLLTEDLFSAIKLHHVLGVGCIALCGTVLKPQTLAFILYNNLKPILWLDGDYAGATGAAAAQRELNALGVQAVAVHDRYQGKDPKDLTEKEIRKIWTSIS